MYPAEEPTRSGPRDPLHAPLPLPTPAEPIIDRAACIAWLRVDCARDHPVAAQQNRRGPIPDRRNLPPDRRQPATNAD